MVSNFSGSVKNLLVITGIIASLERALNQSLKGYLFIYSNKFKEKTKARHEIPH